MDSKGDLAWELRAPSVPGQARLVRGTLPLAATVSARSLLANLAQSRGDPCARAAAPPADEELARAAEWPSRRKSAGPNQSSRAWGEKMEDTYEKAANRPSHYI